MVGGLIAGAAKAGCEAVAPPRPPEQTSPPALLAQRVLGRELSESEQKTVLFAIHFTFSATFGAVYGLLADRIAGITAGCGTVAGIALWGGAHELALPLFELTPPLAELPAYEQINELFSHTIFGLTLESVRARLHNAG